MVTHLHANRNVSVLDHPRYAMSAVPATVHHKDSVTVFVTVSSPQPAAISLVDLGPKAFGKSFEGYVSKGCKVHPGLSLFHRQDLGKFHVESGRWSSRVRSWNRRGLECQVIVSHNS